MAKRTAISKSVRFKIFKRDLFTCQYCGAKPPSVVLHIDHVLPVFEGGTNAIENLITSCIDCNLGKGKELLTVVPDSLEKRAEIEFEKQSQVKALNKLLLDIEKRKEKALVILEKMVSEHANKEMVFSKEAKITIKTTFLAKLAEQEVFNAMELALSRVGGDYDRTFKYFCGVCWNFIKGCSPRGR